MMGKVRNVIKVANVITDLMDPWLNQLLSKTKKGVHTQLKNKKVILQQKQELSIRNLQRIQ